LNSRGGDLFFCYSPECHVFDGNNREYHGESYISSTRPGRYEEGGLETHEISKLLMDTVLFDGLVYYDGKQWRGFNVKVERNGRILTLLPNSEYVKRIFVNIAGEVPEEKFEVLEPGVEIVMHGKGVVSA
jgi:hypothetical protein